MLQRHRNAAVSVIGVQSVARGMESCGAAKESSPQREPWDSAPYDVEPRSGDRYGTVSANRSLSIAPLELITCARFGPTAGALVITHKLVLAALNANGNLCKSFE